MFTPKQLLAIDTRDKEILLSAAAGSGKTAVLIERIIKIITDTKLNININDLLVVTFTNLAAKEMKSRLLQRLNEELSSNPYDANIIKQIKLLPKSNISTLHSFCINCIKQNFHIINIDPGFKIGDINEIAILKQESIFDVFEKYYLENNPTFLKLIELFDEGVSDNKLMEIVLDIYEFSRSNPFPKKWLQDIALFYKKENYTNIYLNPFISGAIEIVENTLTQAIKDLEYCLHLCSVPDGPEKFIDKIKIDLNKLSHIKENLYSEIDYEIYDFKFSTLSGYTNKNSDTVNIDLLEKVKYIRNNIVKKDINNLRDFFISSIEENAQIIFKQSEYVNLIADIVNTFAEVFISKKLDKNILDFSDIEHFTIEILYNTSDNKIIPSQISQAFSNKYYEVLVDEYQDINLIQEYILNGVSKKEETFYRKFMVGDVKQSIYKFRKSKPELFVEKYKNYSHGANENQIKIDLSENFRSRKPILDFTNYIFQYLMREDFGKINYDENAKLNNGKIFPNKPDLDNIEILIGNNDENINKYEFEAYIIGNKINHIIKNNPIQITCKDNSFRNASFKDITLIMRDNVNSKYYIDVFTKLNIPIVGDDKISFFDTYEINLIVSILQIVDNSFQDIFLLSILTSAIFNFTNDELIEIKGSNFNEPFIIAIENYSLKGNYLANRCNDFLNFINEIKDLNKFINISSLVLEIYSRTNLQEYMSALTKGNIRKENLKIFFEKAMEFEKTSLSGLFNFLKYIEKLKQNNVELSSNIDYSNIDTVSITTIHKSKGLEFPIVFFCQMGKDFIFNDTRSNLVKHDDLGFAFKYIDLEKSISYDTLSRQVIINKLLEDKLSEELRLLYVGLTRAKEKLYLSGISNDIQKDLEKYILLANNQSIPKKQLLNTKKYFDFILPTLLRNKKFETIRKEYAILLENKFPAYDENIPFNVTISNSSEIITEEQITNYTKKNTSHSFDNIKTQLDWQYPYIFDTNTTSKISVSELKRKYQEIINPDENIIGTFHNLELPNFYNKTKISNAKKGTILHSIMENLNPTVHNTEEKIVELIDNLTNKGILTSDEVNHINVNKIIKFINSTLGIRLQKASKIYQEMPFIMSIPGNELNQENSSNENIVVQGIIDCYFEENNNIILIDYKTDFYLPEESNSIAEKYKIQIQIYKKALEDSYNKKVIPYLYLFYHDEFIEIKY